MSNVHGGARHGHQPSQQQQQQQQGDSPFCFLHPRELVVGVCAHCLRERLILLLTSTTTRSTSTPTDGASYLSSRTYRSRNSKHNTISLPKVVFALGSSFLQRLDSSSRHHRPAPDVDDFAACTSDDDNSSLDDSFISIKFEGNGKATWDKASGGDIVPPVMAKKTADKAAAAAVRSSMTVVEHVKRGGVTRWRKQVVGRLLQLARWKRSAAKAGGASAAACQMGIDGKKSAAERSKGRGRGWIRSLTRRRAAAHGERAWS